MKKSSIIILMAMCMTVSCGGRGTGAKDSTGRTASRTAGTASAGHGADDTAAQEQQPIKHYTYRVVRVYPHSTDAYTQGLLWHDGYLYEGTGQYGRSELKKVELRTGETVKSTALRKSYFGEGIALLDGKIYQVTWNEKTAFVYDADSFELLETFSYTGEGWGLTTDGEKLYMSDGSDKITVRDPATFRAERVINVTYGRNRLRYVNELEWIDGEIWANVYTTDKVVRIDPRSGRVVGEIDFGGLQSPSDRTPDTDVFNGIAHDPATGNIYVTGKNWNKLYHIEIIEK